jgi:hypothetical protein
MQLDTPDLVSFPGRWPRRQVVAVGNTTSQQVSVSAMVPRLLETRAMDSMAWARSTGSTNGE